MPQEIQGYRKLSATDLDSINEIKDLENKVGSFIQYLVLDRPGQLDNRWISIAVTNLQQGFMALTRSIAKPTSELGPHSFSAISTPPEA